jgi:hypothetical protein
MQSKENVSEVQENVSIEPGSECKQNHKSLAGQLQAPHLKVVALAQDISDDQKSFMKALGVEPGKIRSNTEINILERQKSLNLTPPATNCFN